jgi:hypothetical protein
VLIDSELMKVVTVASSTSITVVRHQSTTAATPHMSGAYAVYGKMNAGGASSWDASQTGSPTFGVFLPAGVTPTGSCTLTSQQYSPVYGVGGPGAVVNGTNSRSAIYQCLGGSWVTGEWPAIPDVTAIRQCTIPVGAAGLSDLTTLGTDATRVSGTIYVGSIDIPRTRVVTLLSSLTGTTAPTTDKQIFALYDSVSGTTAATAIAWTALGGVAAATADIFFDQNLTTPVVLAPGRYFFALQPNGNTTTIQMVASANGYINLVGNSRTGVFGTLGAITVPTTLTTSTAPIGCVG